MPLILQPSAGVGEALQYRKFSVKVRVFRKSVKSARMVKHTGENFNGTRKT